MPTETIPALLALAVGTLFTPGPNNAMLAASGANFGLRRSLPHLFGVALGFPVMLFAVGVLLAGAFQTSALLREGLRWGGAALLFWIAVRLAMSRQMKSGTVGGGPLNFAQAAAFQWVNPKAWSMAVAATSQFVAAAAPVGSAAMVAGTFLSIGLVSAVAWTAAGQAIARWLTTEGRLRWFNLAMAGLILLSVVQIVWH